MASWAIKETFHRVASQPGSTDKKWNRDELIRCRATGTEIKAEIDLKGQVHPVFADWIDTKPEFLQELEQPILLAGKILEAVGLPWLSDFLIEDIFDDDYLGRERSASSKSIFTHRESITPHSIVRHHRDSPAPREKQKKWMRSTRNILRDEFPNLVQWQIDKDIFRKRGWNGYTCRHPRGNLSLSEIDKYETIEEFDRLSLYPGSRNLTILVMAEYPARLRELRQQGQARSEEYLITAFMVTVTILHELGHAIYWRDRRSLTRDFREPFYGGDLEMELGDSFVAAIFGGWVPVPVRQLSKLRKEFSFADGVAWRQALNWDHHRMRPKYRAHYSISVDYIARLFTEASWSTAPDEVAALIRPQSLTGNSIALRTIGLDASLTQNNKHATAAIADFHCEGHGWVWNRRSGAWFRIPQYDGCVYPELELPMAGEGVVCEPVVRELPPMTATRDSPPPPPNPLPAVERNTKEIARLSMDLITGDEVGIPLQTEVRVRGGDGLPSPLQSPLKTRGATGAKTTPGKASPRKFALVSPTTKTTRPLSVGSSALTCSMGVNKPRKRDRARTLPLARKRAVGGQEPQAREPPSPSSSPSPSPQQVKQQHPKAKHAGKPKPPQRKRVGKADGGADGGGGNASCNRAGGCREPDAANHSRGEISVDELKKRLSQLIGVSLTELEKLFDGPACMSAGVE
ncbi:hypothetical protein F4825DRAFT_222716 [Nemania diffusa]|nr:hypothetical protein F4825DRAFT_222716 [Nemania diffusa]